MDNKKFGIKIRECRKACGLDQSELANKVGISTRYLGDIERGETQGFPSNGGVKGSLVQRELSQRSCD